MNINFRRRFEAAHRFLGSKSKKCCTPHGHTWYASMKLTFTGKQLNDSQMGVEFSGLKKDWSLLIDEVFDHSYLHNHKDPIIDSLLKDQPEARLIPFPGDPTTELISLLLFSKMKLIVKNSPHSDNIEVHSITIEETPSNHITCDSGFFETAITQFENYSGWWQKAQVDDRSFKVGK